MAINPPSDIVLDVAKAADPLSYQQATEKLARLAGARASETVTEAFEEVFDQLQKPLPPSTPFDPQLTMVNMRNQDVLADRPAGAGAASYEQLEAFVLQSFVQSMLPTNAAASFGSGTAGDIWKSMLAEQLGAQLAKAGGIGLAQSLAAASPKGDPVPHEPA